MSRIAQIASANLSAANAMIPQVIHHDRADLRAVEAFRKTLKDVGAARGTKITALAFHVMALSRTLRAFPRFNASLTADGETLVLKDYVHIGIAVDTPHGLMVPVIRDADKKACGRSRRISPTSPGARRRASCPATKWAARRCRSRTLAASAAQPSPRS